LIAIFILREKNHVKNSRFFKRYLQIPWNQFIKKNLLKVSSTKFIFIEVFLNKKNRWQLDGFLNLFFATVNFKFPKKQVK
jgi:hypothetical protein